MTCIVGLVNNGDIFMGGDSAGTDSDLGTVVRRDPKVFTRRESKMIFGFTDSFRIGQLIQFNLDIPKHPKGIGTHRYLVTYFIDSLRECLSKGGAVENRNEVEVGGTFLLGYRQHIWEIYSDFQVGLNRYPYNSVGSGADLALGSLHTTEKMKSMITPEKRLHKALEAACEFNASVRSPFKILTLSK